MYWGVFLSFLTGASFIAIGAVYDYAGNRIRMVDAMLIYNWLLVVLLLPFCRQLTAVPIDLGAWMAFAGAINIAAMLLLQKAMAEGRSAIAWAIAQSALIGPFLCGILFFGEIPSPSRITGAAAIVTGMLLLGVVRSRKEKEENKRHTSRNWLKLAFGAFLILAAAQSLVSASSCWNWRMSGLERAWCMSFGSAATLSIFKWFRPGRIEFGQRMRRTVCMLLGTGLVSLLLTFAALDRLAAVSLTGIGYPIMLGSCIAGFALYCAALLKEKISFAQWCAIGGIVGGILLLTFR